MKIVIDIDENVFTKLFDNGTEDCEIVNDDLFTVAKSIRNGTPLPKGHGRLIDADALFNDSELDYTIDGLGCVKWSDVRKAPTVVESDKEEEE